MYTKGLAEVRELPCSKGGTMKFLIVDGTGIAVMCGKVGGAKVEEANARRLAALWNAAEDIEATTEEIAEGVIQFAFELGERHAEVINAAKERIEKLEAEKGESEHALGFAVEAVKRLEAEKAEMLRVLIIAKMLIDEHAKHLTHCSGYQYIEDSINEAIGESCTIIGVGGVSDALEIDVQEKARGEE